MKNNIRRIRKLKGITQEDLAEVCGVARSIISYIETDRMDPKMEVWIKILQTLDAPVLEVFPELEVIKHLF